LELKDFLALTASQEEERQKWMAMQKQQSIANEINRT
jgi:hypothetical protein